MPLSAMRTINVQNVLSTGLRVCGGPALRARVRTVPSLWRAQRKCNLKFQCSLPFYVTLQKPPVRFVFCVLFGFYFECIYQSFQGLE